MTGSSDREKVLLAALIGTIVVAAVIIMAYSYRVHNFGRIRSTGIEVYWNPNGTRVVTEIDWGILKPGDLAGVTVYVGNVRNTNVTLNLAIGNWTPANAGLFFEVSWNLSINYSLNVGQIVPAQIYLQVRTSIEGIDNFSFDISIVATEKPT